MLRQGKFLTGQVQIVVDPLPSCTCLAKCGLNGHPQAWTPLCWSPVLEAATHSLIILLGGILKAEGFGDGFSLAKHIPRHQRAARLAVPAKARNAENKSEILSPMH